MEPLGTYLIQKRVLKMQNIEDALQNQSIMGGKLGTNLVELGYLPLDVLEMHLSNYFGVQAVDHNDLDQISPPLLQSIPKRLIEQYQFLPLKKTGNILRIATMNPQNQAMMKDLSGVLGVQIEPRVASEIRLLFYLGQLCNFQADIRIRSLYFHFRKSHAAGKNLPPPIVAKEKRDLLQKGFKPLEQGEELTSEGFEEYLLQQSITRAQEETKEALTSHPKTPIPPHPKKTEDITEENEPIRELPKSSHITMEDMNRLLPTLQERDQVGDLATRFASQYVHSLVLFVVNSGLVTGWNARGRNLSKDSVRSLVVPIAAESVFQTISQGSAHFFGRLSNEMINQRMLSTLGLKPDQEVLVIPVYLKKRLVNILFAEHGNENLPQPNLNALLDLAKWLPKAYKQLILCRKKEFKDNLKRI